MASTVEVEAAVAAELVEHVVEERQAGARRRPRPAPSRSSVDGDRRLLGGARLRLAGPTPTSGSSRGPPQGGEEGVVLVGVPMVTRRQPRGAATTSSCGRAPSGRAAPATPRRRRAACGRNSTKLAPDGHTSTGRSARRGHEPAPLLDERRDPRRPCRPRSRARGAPASCLTASRWYGSTTFSSSATSHDGPDQVAEPGGGHRPRLGVRAGDDQRHVLVDQLERRPRARTARRPRRRRADRRRRDRVERPRATMPRRLDHAGGVVGRAQERDRRVGARSRTRRTSSRSSAKSAARSPVDHGGAGEPGDVARAARRSARTPRPCGPAPP